MSDEDGFRGIRFIKDRKGFLAYLQEHVTYSKQQTGCKVRYIRLNNAPEFAGSQTKAWAKGKGIAI
jgi:hypothetical protein